MKDLDKEIQEAEAKLAKLREEKKKHNQLTPAQRIAEALHGKLCHWNHVDGCGWEYGSWKEPTDAHKRYLKQAEGMIEIMTDYAGDIAYESGIEPENVDCFVKKRTQITEDTILQIIRIL